MIECFGARSLGLLVYLTGGVYSGVEAAEVDLLEAAAAAAEAAGLAGFGGVGAATGALVPPCPDFGLGWGGAASAPVVEPVGFGAFGFPSSSLNAFVGFHERVDGPSFW